MGIVRTTDPLRFLSKPRKEAVRSFGGAGNASVGDGTGNGTVPLPAGDGRLEHVDIIVPRAYQYSLNWSQARPTFVRTIAWF